MKQFFLHETTVNKMLVADWKTFNIFGNLGKFCASTSSPMYLVLFSDFQNIWICYWKRKKISPFLYPVLLPEICNIWFFFKSWIPQIYQTVEMDEDEEGAYIFIQIIRFYLSLVRSVAYGESEVKLFAGKEIINRW